jgi:hypothetical protein
MPDDGPSEGEARPVTMDDINSLKSSMDAQMESMRKMISELLAPPRPVAPTIEVNITDAVVEGDTSVLPSATTPMDGDNLNTIKPPIASPKGTSGSESYNRVPPPFQSPDIPVPIPI